jgi:protein-S-isoprenylcysteine O-methyltransferase Ste14
LKILKLIDAGAFLVFAGILAAHWQWDARYLIGMAIGATGFVLWMVARRQLGASFSVTAQARKLVTTGLYSKFSNPIYLFAGVAYLGLFIAWGKWIPGVCFLLFYSFQFARAKKESKVLEQAFGDEYRRYKAGTWI